MPPEFGRNNEPIMPKPLATGDAVSSGKLRTIRTYASDMAQAVQEKQGSVVRIVMAEEDKRRREVANVAPTSKRNIIFIAGGMMIIALALAVIVFALTRSKRPAKITETPVAQTIARVIPYDNTVQIDTTGVRLILGNKLEETLVGSYELGSITALSLTDSTKSTQELSITDFINILRLRLPSPFTRSLLPEYMLGIHTFDGNELFLLLKSSSYDATFAGMLAWEKTMTIDLRDIFNIPPSTSAGAIISEKKFEDVVIENKDARAILDETGEIILMYSIPNENTVIITKSKDTFKEILNRLP